MYILEDLSYLYSFFLFHQKSIIKLSEIYYTYLMRVSEVVVAVAAAVVVVAAAVAGLMENLMLSFAEAVLEMAGSQLYQVL